MSRYLFMVAWLIAGSFVLGGENYEAAVKLINAKEYKAAKALLEIEAEEAKTPRVCYALGYVHEKLGETEDAVLNYRLAVAANLNDGNDPDAAERALKSLMALKPYVAKILKHAHELEAESARTKDEVQKDYLKGAAVVLYRYALSKGWDEKRPDEKNIELDDLAREKQIEKALGYNLRWHNRKAVQWEKNGHYYLYVRKPNRITWKKAYEECSDMGGYLVTITSAEENEFVRAKMIGHRGHRTALGLTDKAEEGKMKWITGEPYDYKNWYRDVDNKDPDNRCGKFNDADRVVMTGFRHKNIGLWTDIHDDYPCSGFVCEWEK